MAWAALLVFVTAGYFQNSRPGWNVNTTFALTCAVAERGTLRIDAYHDHPLHPELATGDKAVFEGHVYSDKSPVTSFLGVPAFWVYRQAARAGLVDFSYDRARWWTTWWTCGLAAALLAALLARALAARGVAPHWAAAGGALWIAATPLLGYSVLLFNYLPSCAMALGGWLVVQPLAWRAAALSRHAVLGRAAGGGLLLGLAAWTLNTQAWVALALTGLLAWLMRAAPPRRIAAALAAWTAGGLIGIAGYFIYNYAIFHSFSSPYAYEADPFFREQMARGFMGATAPRAWVAWLVTEHPFQGLFLWWPLATAALAGLMWLIARAGCPRRCEAGAALGILGGLIVYTSAYFMWWGGWAYAPRHLIPALPWLALGLSAWFGARRAGWRWTALAIGVAGAAINVSAVALDPQVPPGLPQEVLLQPERVSEWPAPMAALLRYVWLGGQTDASWGTALGLRGPASLAPLALVWLAAGAWLAWRVRAARDGAIDAPEQASAGPRE